MVNGRAWTRDINELESLARTGMDGVREDISGSADVVAGISVDQASFGELAAGYRVAQTHEHVRARYEQALRVSAERVGAVAMAIAAVAEHYRMLDERYS